MLLGGLVNSTALGLYSIAFLLVGTIDGILSRIIGEISFPAFSEVVRERPAELKRNYYAFHGVIATAAYLASGVLMVSGQSIIDLLYDRRYEQAGWILQLLAAVLLTVPFRLATQIFWRWDSRSCNPISFWLGCIAFCTYRHCFLYFSDFRERLCNCISHFSSLPLTIFYNVRNHVFDLRKELLHLFCVPLGLVAGKLFLIAIAFLK